MDQPGVAIAERLIPKPDRGKKPGPEGFEDDIRIRRETPEQVPAVGGVEVQRDAAFRGVVVPEGQAALGVGDVVEKRPDMTAGLAPRRLDLDHIGPEIAEQLAAELAG